MRTLIWSLACCLSVLIAPAAMAQDRGLAIEYTVKVADIPGQLFHVTTDIRNVNQPTLDLSLPVWSPGWYVIENYAKNILRFRVTDPGGRELVGQASHEFFHVWNVKRIRPVEMWPYDYARENETPLLWVSEGFTSYYAGLALYRAGLRDARSFVGEAARAIGEVEGNEARRYISASDSSMSTWLGYNSPLPFSISYYSQGRNIAGLLDLSIRHDTNGAFGLDEVMRALFTDFYQRGRGFSTGDLIRVVNRIARRSYDSFFSRYAVTL